MCAVTRAGYWTEFEIKLTRQDFLKDKAKDRKVYDRDDIGLIKVIENKHELLTSTDRGPARFYYAVKDGVADTKDIPTWAGLLVFKWERYDERDDGRWVVSEVKKAGLRHRRKDEGLINQMYRAAWYRGIGKLL